MNRTRPVKGEFSPKEGVMPEFACRSFVFAALLLTIPLTSSEGTAQESKPTDLTAEEQKLAADTKKLNDEAQQLYRRGKYADAVERLREALALNQKLYPVARYADGHPVLAGSLHDLGYMLLERGAYAQALSYLEQSLAMKEKLYPAAKHPDGHPELAVTLDNLGIVLQVMGAPARALPHLERALAIRRALYPAAKFPDGHPDLAQNLTILGSLHHAMGSSAKAVAYLEEALAMNQKLYPPAKYPDGHADVAFTLNNLGLLLQETGAFGKALPCLEQALAMNQKLYPPARYPDGHRVLARGLNNLGMLFNMMGTPARGLPYFEQALAMNQKLYPAARYPDGHRDLAISLINMGGMLESMGAPAKALPHHERALAMMEKLYPATKYPNGHPELAQSLENLGLLLIQMGAPVKALPYLERVLTMQQALYPPTTFPVGHPAIASILNNIGGLHREMKDPAQALRYFEPALAMRQALYPAATFPAGHPHVAASLNSVGFLLWETGAAAKAVPFLEQALAMNRTLYPAVQFANGHPDLVRSLDNLGLLLQSVGSYKLALQYHEQALGMQGRLTRGLAAIAAEADALAFVQAQPLTRDALLSCALQVPDTAAVACGAVWNTKSSVARVLAQRHAAARAAGTGHAAKLDELRTLRRRIDQLLQDRRLPPAERDGLLAKAADDRDRLDRDLAAALPMLPRAAEMDSLGPDALVPRLPEHAVLIEMVRYRRFDYDSTKLGKASEIRADCYAAFVAAKGRAVRRIELGPAEPIDAAVARWRAAIEARDDRPAATELRGMVWEKLAAHLPAGTRTLYVSPDGDLARLPWAALPTGTDRRLLDEYAVAVVPHGRFLLEQLTYPPKYDTVESVLALGQVAYHSAAWPDLPATATELKALAVRAPVLLTADTATPARVRAELPKARYAHFATHGYFDADTLKVERKRFEEAAKNRRFGDEVRPVAVSNPLGYVGLVLAGGEVLSGLALVDLSLENLRLATLSACETGLGEYTGGKGVENLQQAFHLAGCPNVIASLWKVNDAATAALMAKFYHELWVNHKPPIDALRAAQLTIYRYPELIPDLAGERGAPKLQEAVTAKAGDSRAPADGRHRADTKLWASFVLSGLGK
jgi:CHAT domain-containing protein/Tfp pilus assembly protein PilF